MIDLVRSMEAIIMYFIFETPLIRKGFVMAPYDLSIS